MPGPEEWFVDSAGKKKDQEENHSYINNVGVKRKKRKPVGVVRGKRKAREDLL